MALHVLLRPAASVAGVEPPQHPVLRSTLGSACRACVRSRSRCVAAASPSYAAEGAQVTADSYTYNTLLSAFERGAQPQMALHFLRPMASTSVTPTAATGMVSVGGRNRGERWEALSEFQRFCAVNGMVFASVPAGRGSSGGPLINGRGEVVGITTWQFQSTPLLTAAVSASTLHQLLPELLQGSGGVSAPTIGVEEHLGPAKLRLELWWLDEVKSIQGKPVESVADVYEVVQSAPVGAQLQLQLKRFGFFDVNASAVVRCRPPQQHQLLRRLLRATWRALSTAQVALAIHEFTRNVRKDLTKVRSAVEEMEKCGFFNVSHKDDNMKQLSLATARFLVKGDAFKNLCLPPRSHAQCVVPTNAKKKTWKRVPLFDLCRLNCNAQIIDTPTFCCMHVAQTKTCQLISGGNATTTSRLMGSVATICKPMPVLQLLRALKLLWALALSVLRD
eukprot:g23938.t1